MRDQAVGAVRHKAQISCAPPPQLRHGVALRSAKHELKVRLAGKLNFLPPCLNDLVLDERVGCGAEAHLQAYPSRGVARIAYDAVQCSDGGDRRWRTAVAEVGASAAVAHAHDDRSTLRNTDTHTAFEALSL